MTLVAPFMRASLLGVAVLADLGALFGATPAFDVRFPRAGRFPEVVYLDPDPAAPFAGLTRELVRRYPDSPPYGGEYADPVPHLTVLRARSEDELAAAERELAARLPLTARALEAWLVGRRRDGAWSRLARFPFGAAG